MLSAGIPELRTASDIGYLRKTLNLEVSEDEAVKQFNKRLKEAVDNSWKTSINWAVHNKVRQKPKNG
jgi:phosphatidylinositol-4,5-bisphosphate 3-kinase